MFNFQVAKKSKRTQLVMYLDESNIDFDFFSK